MKKEYQKMGRKANGKIREIALKTYRAFQNPKDPDPDNADLEKNEKSK